MWRVSRLQDSVECCVRISQIIRWTAQCIIAMIDARFSTKRDHHGNRICHALLRGLRNRFAPLRGRHTRDGRLAPHRTPRNTIMNTLHPTDALFLATVHLDALRMSARAQEAADAAARHVSCRGNRRITAGPAPNPPDAQPAAEHLRTAFGGVLPPYLGATSLPASRARFDTGAGVVGE